jgi:hypothetical protein
MDRSIAKVTDGQLIIVPNTRLGENLIYRYKIDALRWRIQPIDATLGDID